MIKSSTKGTKMKKIKILGNYYNYPTIKELKKVTFGDLGKLDNFTIPPYKDSTWGKVMFTLGDFNFYVTIDTVDIPTIDLNQKILDTKSGDYRINYFVRNGGFVNLSYGMVHDTELFDYNENLSTFNNKGKIDLELVLLNLKEDKRVELINQLESTEYKEFSIKISQDMTSSEYAKEGNITLSIKDSKYYHKHNNTTNYPINYPLPNDKKIAIFGCKLLTGNDDLLQKDNKIVNNINKLDDEIAKKAETLLKLLKKKDTLIPKIIGTDAEYSKAIIGFEDSCNDYESSSLRREVENFLEYIEDKSNGTHDE